MMYPLVVHLALQGLNMAYGDDAKEAIEDISEAIEEYGSYVTIRSVTKDQSTYDPRNPSSGIVNVDTPTKALISTEASKDLKTSMPKELIGTYQIAMRLQSTEVITKAHKILYDGKVYEVLYPSKKVLQNEVLLYEILVG